MSVRMALRPLNRTGRRQTLRKPALTSLLRLRRRRRFHHRCHNRWAHLRWPDAMGRPHLIRNAWFTILRRVRAAAFRTAPLGWTSVFMSGLTSRLSMM